jgi:hypothetical protein
VVKDLLEKLGGNEMKSRTDPPDQGTRFTLFIPSVVSSPPSLEQEFREPESESAVS